MQLDPEDIIHTLYVQPKGSGMCGQYSVAHIADITPEESIMAFVATGTKKNTPRGTSTKQVHKALDFLGYKTPPRMQILQPGENLPKLCMLGVRWIEPGTERHGAGHWIVYNRGYVICSGPDMAGVYKIEKYLKDRTGVCISYLEVTKR